MSHISNTGHTIFTTMAQCSSQTNTPKNLLRLAKANGAPGFIGNRIDWDELQPWLEAHKDTLLNDADDSLNKWKLRKTKADALTAELELEEMKSQYLIKEEVKAFLQSIAAAQLAVLKSKLVQELPSKLLGLGVTETAVIMEQTVTELCNIFQSGLDKWK